MKKIIVTVSALLCLTILSGSILLPAAFASEIRDYADLINAYANLIDTIDSVDDDDDDDVSSNNTAPAQPQKHFSGPMTRVRVGSKTVRVHKAFKRAMDKYEKFFEEYVEFMKKPDMHRYAEIMAEYSEALEALEDLGDYDLTEAELAYYLEVYARIMDNLADVYD